LFHREKREEPPYGEEETNKREGKKEIRRLSVQRAEVRKKSGAEV